MLVKALRMQYSEGLFTIYKLNTMRLYIQDETEKAYQLEGITFKKRWIPKKAVTIEENSERAGLLGTSHEMDIAKWALQ